MFKTILLVHSCIFLLVKSNPLQGLPLYPVIQYQEDFRNRLPILVQPSDFNAYPHLHLTPNQLTPYQNSPISFSDYVLQIYLDSILPNGIKSAINADCVQNGDQILRYVSPTDISQPNVINNYIIVPVETNPKNSTKDCHKRKRTKTRVDGISPNINENVDQKKNRKCRKRKNTSKNTNDKGHENIEKRSRDKKIDRGEKNSEVNKQSSDQDVKVCRKKKSRNKSQTSDTPEEKIPLERDKQTKDKNPNIKSGNNQCSTKKNLNKIEKTSKTINSEDDTQEISKKVKNKSNNCRKVIKNDDCYDFDRIRELDDYFNINEDCAELDSRCTRNNREDIIQKYQQQYFLPSDFSSNMSPYNMMFNQQSFDTNGYFPFNFDYLYNMQQFANENLTPSQNKPKNNRQTGRRKKQKKGNKKNCDRNKQNTKQNGGCEIKLESLPIIVDVATGHEPDSTKIANIHETIIEKTYQNVPDINREETDVLLSSHEDLKEIAPHACFNWNHEDLSPIYNDYLPVFHSDNVYRSEEEFDWNNFNDRHYYSSSSMSEQYKERNKYDSTDDGLITQQDNIVKPNDVKPFIYINNVGKENNEKVPFEIKLNSQEENDNIQLKTSSEEIQFKTPPALDFPDFKTEMINKEHHIPKIEIYYQPNNKAINKYENSKMSSYSDTKKAESNEKRNKVVDQNEVETVSGHSKVVKYGASSNNGELCIDIINASDYSGEEDKLPHRNAGKTTIVIAKSLPYPI